MVSAKDIVVKPITQAANVLLSARIILARLPTAKLHFGVFFLNRKLEGAMSFPPINKKGTTNVVAQPMEPYAELNRHGI